MAKLTDSPLSGVTFNFLGDVLGHFRPPGTAHKADGKVTATINLEHISVPLAVIIPSSQY